ncbi:segregation and condensation protein A [Bifidobacterium longum]|uniref:segregation and condensation protein A n=1 Tax=Bifidobacterium longum TaxID=216816 RepID=UPI0018D09B5A|nr:ScpA family protein [Bifidobacterium longum]MBH0363452.1 segregation/condensation protein A [Bifidobacterium longum]MBM5829604.1 segregation/condensation protein A [Bifidobacterium longum subsp. suillum]QSG87068.1 segregation/condensation protein A [Bifidobacterium longum subsp. suillum]QXT31498.1 segregation/condensation protein A [Bifidobacterium longum subsp. suillum]
MNETSLSRLPSLREAGSRSETEGSSAEDEISTEESATSGFRVNLEVYSGPFDALLGMIANNKLELTEVSLSSITEEFLTYVRGLDFTKNMDEASAFLDIASILVEAKSVAILPGGEDNQYDEQSLEALRERDLLFARLLQYRAYKQAAGDFRARIAANAGRFPHPAAMDEGIAAMLPELVWTLTPLELAQLAAQVIANAPASEVSIHQLHVPLVDLRAQSLVVRDRLIAALESKGDQSMSFSELTRDCTSRIEVVARFMAVLVFFKQGVLQYQQDGPFAELHLRWVSGVDETMNDVNISEGDFA